MLLLLTKLTQYFCVISVHDATSCGKITYLESLGSVSHPCKNRRTLKGAKNDKNLLKRKELKTNEKDKILHLNQLNEKKIS